MHRTTFSMALAALVVSGLSAYGVLRDRRGSGVDPDLAQRVSDLERSRARPDEGPPPSTTLDAELADRVAELVRRVARLEAAPRRAVTSEAAIRTDDAAPPRASAAPADANGVAHETAGDSDPEGRAELEALMAELLGPGQDWERSTDALERFYELARGTNLIEERIAELEGAVEANPADLEARMALADTYVAKLLTIQGPEAGLWGARAEEQWHAVSERDPDHWRAHFSLGNNYAYYPDAMGKTDDAIGFLEHAREIQERAAQDADQVRTYLVLAQMYRRRGEIEKARDVLRSGLIHHVGNAELEAALDGLGE
jgi:tetratricopeptide (TPR) repeat protein